MTTIKTFFASLVARFVTLDAIKGEYERLSRKAQRNAEEAAENASLYLALEGRHTADLVRHSKIVTKLEELLS